MDIIHPRFLIFSIFSALLLTFSDSEAAGVAGQPASSPEYEYLPGFDLLTEVSIYVYDNVNMISKKGLQLRQEIVGNRLNDPKVEGLARKCLQQCNDNYNSAEQATSIILDGINNREFPKVKAYLDALTFDVDRCDQCMSGVRSGIFPEYHEFHVLVRDVTRDCHRELKKLKEYF